MSPSVALRPVTPDDQPILFDVYAGTRVSELEGTAWSDEEKKAFLRFQFEAQHRHYETHFKEADYSVVVVDGEPVGRLWVDYRDDEIRILDIALLPEKRGMGVGTKILRDLLRRAAAEKKLVRVYIEDYQKSMSLFERFGFRVVEENGPNRLFEWSPALALDDVTSRPVGEADDAFLLELYRRQREPELVELRWDESQISAFVEIQFRAQRLGYGAQYPNADHLIILRANEPIGRLSLHRTGERITVVDIALLPEARGLGIGTRLLKGVLAQAREKRIPVSLKVAVGNPARRLYSRLGFERLGSNGVYEQMEWRPSQ